MHERRQVHMTLITPPEGVSQLDQALEEVRNTFSSVTRILKIYEADLLSGDDNAIKEANKLLGDIRNWLRVAIETEARFEQRQKEKLGIVNAYAIDLAEARSSIGCRLDRLRRSGCPGCVSE